MARRLRIRLVVCAAALSVAAWGSAAHAAGRQIVGGSDAPGDWPAMASVLATGPGGTVVCGGTLLSARWVLTAGHCFDESPETTLVRLGGRTLGDPAAVTHLAAEVIRHPSYRKDEFPDDLALIGLQSASTAAPQMLADVQDVGLVAAGAATTILGWGALREGGELSFERQLQQAHVPVVTDRACRDVYPSDFVAETMLCAGRPEGGVDTCQGDSGGPLLAGPAPGALRLVGVTSWGQGCARPGRPGVYVRLQNPRFQRWIRDLAPVDGFSVSPFLPVEGERVRLTSTATSPGSGPPIAAQAWDLDADGEFDDATGGSATVAFARAGQPLVALRVTRAAGTTSVARTAIVVRPAPVTPSGTPDAQSAAPGGAPTAAAAPPTGPASPPASSPPVAPSSKPLPAPAKAAVPRASLRIIASSAVTARRRAYTLRCGPTGGSWPARKAACGRLLSPGGAVVLTQSVRRQGGRANASGALRVTGIVDGKRISLELSRRGSAGVRARFAAVRRLLGADATDRAIRAPTHQ